MTIKFLYSKSRVLSFFQLNLKVKSLHTELEELHEKKESVNIQVDQVYFISLYFLLINIIIYIIMVGS